MNVINNISSQIKIVWISDIHFRGDDQYNHVSIDSFVKYLENSINSEINTYFGDIYILITGDIAFNGNEFSQYSDIRKLVKRVIGRNNYERVKVVVCPGNHDVSWKEFYNIFNDIPKKDLNKVINFFKNKKSSFNREKFSKLFINYSNNLSPNSRRLAEDNKDEIELIKDDCFYFPKSNKRFEVSEDYYNDGLDGYLIDKTNKLMFVIVNTAWYAIGNSLKEFIYGLTEYEYTIPILIELIEASKEYGQMVSGLGFNQNLSYFTNLISKVEEYRDLSYTIIGLMHHPLEWMDWSEKDNYAIGEPNLIKILKSCNLILSGHIHPSRHNKYELLFSERKVLHLRSPQFLGHDQTTESGLFPCNGFTILHICNNNLHSKFYYYDKIITVSGAQEPDKLWHEILDPIMINGRTELNISEENTKNIFNYSNLNGGNQKEDFFYEINGSFDIIEFIKTFCVLNDVIETNIIKDNYSDLDAFLYERRLFILQKNLKWILPLEFVEIIVADIFINATIEQIVFLKSGYDIRCEINSDDNFIDASEEFKILTEINDKQLNDIRIIFFNTLDLFLSIEKDENIQEVEEKINDIEEKKLFQFFKNKGNVLSLTYFNKFKEVSFSNQVLESNWFS